MDKRLPKTEVGRLHKRWAQKRNGDKFILHGVRSNLTHIVAGKGILLHGEKEELKEIIHLLDNTIAAWKERNRASKTEYMKIHGIIE